MTILDGLLAILFAAALFMHYLIWRKLGQMDEQSYRLPTDQELNHVQATWDSDTKDSKIVSHSKGL